MLRWVISGLQPTVANSSSATALCVLQKFGTTAAFAERQNRFRVAYSTVCFTPTLAEPLRVAKPRRVTFCQRSPPCELVSDCLHSGQFSAAFGTHDAPVFAFGTNTGNRTQNHLVGIQKLYH